MKKIAFILAALFLITNTSVYAMHHENKTPEQREAYLQKKIEKITKELDLSESQKMQYETILKVKMDKKDVAKQRMDVEMETIKNEYKASVSAMLSAEQKTKFDKMMTKYDKKKSKKKKKFLLF